MLDWLLFAVESDTSTQPFIATDGRFVVRFTGATFSLWQMTLALTTASLLLLVGLHAVTWIFVAVTMMLTITSRLLYHGRKAPNQTK